MIWPRELVTNASTVTNSRFLVTTLTTILLITIQMEYAGRVLPWCTEHHPFPAGDLAGAMPLKINANQLDGAPVILSAKSLQTGHRSKVFPDACLQGPVFRRLAMLNY